MKTIQSIALLGAAFIAACSERQSTTAPFADGTGLAPHVIADRLYTWSLTCNGSSGYIGGGISANWSWTKDGATITGTEQDATCSPVGNSGNKVSGSGIRPSDANGFEACVGGYSCANWTTWSFDPSGSFNAQLKGSVTVPCIDPFNCKYTTYTISGTLKVTS